MTRPACIPLLLVTCLAACAEDKLSSASGELRVSDEALTFAPAWVGYPVERSVELFNDARADRPVRLTAASPFQVVDPPSNIPGGGTRRVTVRLLPDAEGTLAAALELESDGQRHAVQLSAMAVVPPTCGGGDVCAPSVFDPVLGACVVQPAADGVPCNSPCVTGGACRSGMCVGTAAACDDGNACTADACDVVNGCVHLDTSASCPEPAHPCKVPFCDAVGGCGIADAADGTPCGAFSCELADVCISGSCKSVAVPEGTTCAPASPCQGKGTCVAKQCVQPDPGPLQPAWTYTPPAGLQLHFSGVADGNGALYWLECGATCELVSLTRGGLPRYRTPVPGSGAYAYNWERRLLLRDGTVVVTSGENLLTGVRASDGAIQWTRDLTLHADPQAEVVHVRTIAAGRSDGLYVVLTGLRGPSGSMTRLPDRLIALADDGTLRWTQVLEVVDGLVVDEAGQVFLRSYDYGVSPHAPPSLVSFTPDGVQRFRSPTWGGMPQAVHGGVVVQNGGFLASAADGTSKSMSGMFTDSYGGGVQSEPLLSGGAGFAVVQSYSCLGFVGTDEAMLMRFDPSKGEVSWMRRLDDGPVSGPWSFGRGGQPVLVAGGSVLVPWVPLGGNTWRLSHVDGAGNTRFACDLPDEAWWTSPAVMHQDRWFSARSVYNLVESWQVVAYDLPGLKPATSGWTTYSGVPSGGGHPAP